MVKILIREGAKVSSLNFTEGRWRENMNSRACPKTDNTVPICHAELVSASNEINVL